MELTVLHLYPDVMNLYGEYANLKVLCRHLSSLGVEVTVRVAEADDKICFDDAGLIYMGCGTERMQKFIMERLRSEGDSLKAAAERGAVVLFTGSAMEILGASVTDSEGTVYPALGLADFTTVETEKRITEDVIALTDLTGDPVAGFMNKCSLTSGIDTPLFSKLMLGFGNEKELGAEGYRKGNILATHITGPVLVKNPSLIDAVIRLLAKNRDWILPDSLPRFPHEEDAYNVTLSELKARVKG